MNQEDMVREFHRVYGQRIAKCPQLPKTSERELRKRLLKEEYNEYLQGEENNDLVEIADALGDMIYIICGTAVSYGIPITEIFNEIHRSNMSKLDENGKPIYREDGKILKGPGYFKPNLSAIIEKAGCDNCNCEGKGKIL